MNKGFTLIETLLALLAISMCVLLLVPILHLMTSMKYPLAYTEDILGIMRMRYVLSQSSIEEVNDESILFRFHGEEWTLSFHHQNIVKEAGYEIMLMKVSEANFYENNSCLYLYYEKETEQEGKDVLLTCE